jgi:replicative DNA helicase
MINELLKFQKEILFLLCNNLNFANNYNNLLFKHYFSSKELQIIYEIISEYILTYESILTYKQLLIEVEKKSYEIGFSIDLLKSINQECKEIFETDIINEKYILDNFIAFIRYQGLKNALIKSINILEKGKSKDYNKVLKEINWAVSIGDTLDIGYNFDDMTGILNILKERYNTKNLIKTGFKKFDESMMGGLAPSEVHVIMSPPKTGKTTLGVNIGFNALLKNTIVFHISLEISKEDIMYKYAILFTKSNYKDLIKMEKQEYEKKINIIKKINPKLFVKHWPEKSISTIEIRSWISRIKLQHNIKDEKVLVIIDYDDCLLSISNKANNIYDESGDIYSDIINLAHYFQYPILTFSQPNRSGWSKAKNKTSLISSEDISHSARKIHRATSISSLNFAPGENNGYLYIADSRRGYSGVSIEIERDFEKSTIREKLNKEDDTI